MIDLCDTGCDEAGAALLGGALHGSEAARAAVAKLTLDDLTDTRQRAVLEAMLALISRDVPIDPVTVLGQLRAEGADVKMPAGRDAGVFIADLMENAVGTDPAYHLDVIWQHALRRMARAFGQRVTQAAGSSSLADLVQIVRDDAIRIIAAAKRVGVSP